VHCARGDDGLAHLERGGWDALVLDLMLPGVDGLEICRRARAMTRYTPIIIISARSSRCIAFWDWRSAPTTIWPSRFPCWNSWHG
jgi:DNA-binding NarL/FixJ family response regulator